VAQLRGARRRGRVGRERLDELAEVGAVVEEGQALGERVDRELGDREELVGGDKALAPAVERAEALVERLDLLLGDCARGRGGGGEAAAAAAAAGRPGGAGGGSGAGSQAPPVCSTSSSTSAWFRP
jgi:hypothetical protein